MAADAMEDRSESLEARGGIITVYMPLSLYFRKTRRVGRATGTIPHAETSYCLLSPIRQGDHVCQMTWGDGGAGGSPDVRTDIS